MNNKRVSVSVGLDVAATVVVWLIFYVYRVVVNDMSLADGEWSWATPSYNLGLSAVAFPAVALAVHSLSGLYVPNHTISRLNELTTTAVSTFLITVILFFSMLIDDKVVSYVSYTRSFFVLWLLLFVFTYTERLIYTVILFARERRNPHNVIIIGTGRQARRAIGYFKNSRLRRTHHFSGYVATDHGDVVTTSVIGHIGDVAEIVAERRISLAIIATDRTDDEVIFPIISRLIQCNVGIKLVPDKVDIITGKTSIESVAAEPFINITGLSMPAWQQAVKRAFDIVVAGVGMVVLAPVYVFLALRVRGDSRGGVIFRQERIGRNGLPFTIYKFRTMYRDAEVGGPALSSVRDRRITPFGRTMRKYRLDELPQLWNILRGDMSVVGPRPERRYYIDQIERQAPYYPLIYKTRPGLLSWGPIRIGYADTIEKMISRLNYDIVYINNMSIMLDVKIMLYSISVIFNGKGQ